MNSEEVKKLITELTPLFIEYGLNILGAILIFILGFWLSKFLANNAKKRLKKIETIDDTVIPILANVVRITIMVITIFAVLNQFGVESASIIAVLGAAGLAIGLALQGTLSNVASGVMLLILRPFKAGDVVKVNGNVCIVVELRLFLSKFKTFDNVNIYLPNSSVWGSEIQNFSQNDTRRNDILMSIAYDDDIDKAMEVSLEELNKDERVLSDPAPQIFVNTLGESSVDIMVRYWTQSSDFFPTKIDMIKRMKQRYDAEGLTIPFPQRDIHLFQAK